MNKSCKAVWEVIQEVIESDEQLGNKLADVFTDFECSWKEHTEEHHS